MYAGGDYLRVKDVQAYLSISRSSAYYICDGTRFPVRRIGKLVLIKKAELDEYLDACKA